MHRGSTLSDAIGYVFEYALESTYPFLRTIPRGSNLPDFRADGFYLEAKVGYREYGARIKPEQIEKFRSADMPVFYMFGFHDVCGLKKMRKSLAARMIADMQFGERYLVDNLLIESFFEKEHRISKKDKVDYCIIKPVHFRQIKNNERISRAGSEMLAHDFYDINKGNYNFSKINGVQVLVRNENLGIVRPLLD